MQLFSNKKSKNLVDNDLLLLIANFTITNFSNYLSY